jgi:hypothetical protein
VGPSSRGLDDSVEIQGALALELQKLDRFLKALLSLRAAP